MTSSPYEPPRAKALERSLRLSDHEAAWRLVSRLGRYYVSVSLLLVGAVFGLSLLAETSLRAAALLAIPMVFGCGLWIVVAGGLVLAACALEWTRGRRLSALGIGLLGFCSAGLLILPYLLLEARSRSAASEP